jgi:hypothetical protein
MPIEAPKSLEAVQLDRDSVREYDYGRFTALSAFACVHAAMHDTLAAPMLTVHARLATAAAAEAAACVLLQGADNPVADAVCAAPPVDVFYISSHLRGCIHHAVPRRAVQTTHS